MRLQQSMKSAGIMQRDLADMLNIDAGNMSRIAVGRVLPRPDQLRLICEALNCRPLDIYDHEEIDLIHCMPPEPPEGTAPGQTRPFVRKVQFRRSELACKVLDADVLKLHGFDSAQEWFDAQIGNTVNRWKL